MNIFFTSPSKWIRLLKKTYAFLFGTGLLLFLTGLYWSLVVAPPDYLQGEGMRIMYVHVPASWMGLFVYALVGVMGLIYFVWRSPVAYIMAKAATPIGALFTFMSLTTGSIWGKPMWGTWWVWDARLTSMLLLFFLYLGLMALKDAFDDQEKAAKTFSIVALLGLINLPIIKWSVNWWNTLHQPATLTKLSAPSIHGSMLLPLLIMASAFMIYFLLMFFLRIEKEFLQMKAR